ncbi:RagB/SusD family nutrient uptake outer membrane protein [Dinghuibacter silviterrae]|uniref:Putative outer membrane starch-binding protein n=1 Tax=Dinghuibacter silviterrae TaxID=1539049 RepID=A0A4R8DSW3_9BACT|nr:RagB/SusD family nutrient uptake outer membrane protein [Dinghuibacter silviterrae]TDX00968.1 putative outer membrane starch-binding protein [Dinghuibacter silviterrae]
MKRYTFLSAAILLFCSCNKLMNNIQPKDQLSGSVVYSSVSEANLGVLGVYSAWDPEYVNQIGSEVADECRIGLANTGAGLAVGISGPGQVLFPWAFSSQSSEILAPWTNGYEVINDANLVLSALPAVPVTNTSDSLEKLELQGELLAIRAFAHFDLYRVYAYSGIYDSTALAIPYVTTTNIYSLPARPATGAFFTQLKADMSAAESLIGSSNGLYRMNLVALYALEARVALYTEDWTTAISRSATVINAVPLATQAQFPATWTDAGASEEIFSLLRTTQSVVRPGDLWYNIPYGVYLFNPAKALMSLYDTVNDVRYHSYFATDSSLIASGELPDIIVKYEGAAGARNVNNLKVLRTGEQYLIRAEAYAQSDNLSAGAADLNILRAQRITGYQPVTFSNKANLLAAIFQERYKELCYEGHRLYDLKREGANVQRATIDLPPGVTNGTLTSSSMYYYIPIPLTEVNANPHILPNNPGW